MNLISIATKQALIFFVISAFPRFLWCYNKYFLFHLSKNYTIGYYNLHIEMNLTIPHMTIFLPINKNQNNQSYSKIYIVASK